MLSCHGRSLPRIPGQAPPQLAPANPALPIDLDAAFSELDRRNNRLIFRQLNIRQGALAIKADEATADPGGFREQRVGLHRQCQHR